MIEDIQDYKRILNEINEVVIICDFKGKILYTNKKGLELFKVKEKEVYKKNVIHFIAPQSRSLALRDILNVLRGKEGYYSEYLVCDSYGNKFWVEAVGRKFQFEGKKVLLGTLRDITEKKKLEEQIKKSERKYRELYESTRDGIVMVNMKGRILECNKAYLRMTGYKKEEISKITYQKLTPLKWRKIEAEIVKNQILKKGYSDIYEKQYIRKDGKIIDVQLITWLIKDEKGNPVGMWAIVRDITEKKRLEEQIKKSERKYHELYKSIRDGVARVDMRGYIVECNQLFLVMTGYSEKEIKKFTYQEITHPKWHKMEAEIIKNQVLKKGYSDIYEKQYIRKDGKIIDVQLITYLIKDEEGRPTGMWAIVRDITEKKRVETRIKESEERLKMVLDNVPVHVAMIDKNRRFMLWNKYSEKMFGYKDKEVIGKITPYEIHTSKKEADMVVKTAIKNGFFEGEVQFRRKNGETFPAKLMVIPHKDEKGKIIGFYGIAYDISKEKAILNQLKEHSRELERMNNLMVGRELRMIELKNKIKELEKKLAQKNGR